MLIAFLIVVAVLGWIGCVFFSIESFKEFDHAFRLRREIESLVAERDRANLREDAMEKRAFRYKHRLEKLLGRKVK